jgi:hypothetical protein
LVWVVPNKVALVPGISCELSHAPDVMRGEADAKERAARALAKDAEEAARRRAQLQAREGLSEVTIPEREKALREAQDVRSSLTAEGSISESFDAELLKDIAEAQAALDKAKADRDAIAPGDAGEASKNEQAAREAARKAADEAAASRAAAMTGQQRNELEGQADALRTGGKIDSLMWAGDAAAAAAKKQREEAEAKAAEKAAKKTPGAEGEGPNVMPSTHGYGGLANDLKGAGFTDAAAKIEGAAQTLRQGGDGEAVLQALQAVEKALQAAQRGDLAAKVDAQAKRLEQLAARMANASR